MIYERGGLVEFRIPRSGVFLDLVKKLIRLGDEVSLNLRSRGDVDPTPKPFLTALREMVLELKEALPEQVESLWVSNFDCIHIYDEANIQLGELHWTYNPTS